MNQDGWEPQNVAVWAWRLAVLAALIWLGVEIRSLAEWMPSDVPTSRELMVQLRDLSAKLESIRNSLSGR